MENEIINIWYKVYQSIDYGFGQFLYLSGTALLVTVVVGYLVRVCEVFFKFLTNFSAGAPHNSCACRSEEIFDDDDIEDDEDLEEFNDEYGSTHRVPTQRYNRLIQEEQELVSVCREIGDALKDTPGWPKKDMPFVQKSILAINDLKEKAGLRKEKPKPKQGMSLKESLAPNKGYKK